MIRLNRFGLVAGVLTAAWVVCGCSFNQPTLTQTGEEHRNAVRTVWERDKAALIDDLDLVFQTDRPTRLSKWHDK